jgi:hypothetical protein
MTIRPGQGLLFNDYFQMAYVTTDLERGQKEFSDRFGIKEFKTITGNPIDGDLVSISLAWVGGHMYELIKCTGTGPTAQMYNERLPTSGFAIRHHHLGFMIGDQAGWDALRGEIKRTGYKITMDMKMDGFMHAIYIEVPILGHYLEYIFAEPSGIEFLETVPSY